MEKKPSEVKSLKQGSFVIVDDDPCRVDDISISRPGKHGAAKARVVAVGLFTNQKHIFVKPADARIDVPVIEKRNCQVIAFVGDNVQIMDTETFEMSEVKKPEDIQISEGDEILVWKFGHHAMIKQKK